METQLLDAGTLAIELDRALHVLPGLSGGHGLRVMGQTDTESVIHASVASGITTQGTLGRVPHDPGLIVAALVVGVVIGIFIGRKTATTVTKAS